MTPTEAVTQVTLIFALTLALSFVIERILELLKSAYDLADGRYNYYQRWTRQAERIRDYIETRLRIFQHLDKPTAAALLARFDDMMLGRQAGADSKVPVLCGDLVRAVYCKVALKVIGAAIGIWFAFQFGLDLLALSAVKPGETAAVTVLGRIATGIAMGLGSGVVHKMITAVERKQQKNANASAEVANA